MRRASSSFFASCRRETASLSGPPAGAAGAVITWIPPQRARNSSSSRTRPLSRPPWSWAWQMRYTACPCSLRSPSNSTRLAPGAPGEARSVAFPARSGRSAPIPPPRRVPSPRSCQRIVSTSKPPRSPRMSTMSRPLVAASSSRRWVRAKIRRWTAQASMLSPAISTECSCESGLSMSSSSEALNSLMTTPLRGYLSIFSSSSVLLDDRGTKLPQLRLDGARVGRPHADQQLLPRRAGFQVRIRVLVEHPRLLEQNRPGRLGGAQQVIDRLHQAVVEVLARIAEILVRLLEEPVQPLVDERERARVAGLHDLHERPVALEVRIAQGRELALGGNRGLPGCHLDRAQLDGEFLARQVVHGDDDVPHDVLRREVVLDRMTAEHADERVAHQWIAVVERRQRHRRARLLAERMRDLRLGAHPRPRRLRHPDRRRGAMACGVPVPAPDRDCGHDHAAGQPQPPALRRTLAIILPHG